MAHNMSNLLINVVLSSVKAVKTVSSFCALLSENVSFDTYRLARVADYLYYCCGANRMLLKAYLMI